jgi:hypothetical protein
VVRPLHPSDAVQQAASFPWALLRRPAEPDPGLDRDADAERILRDRQSRDYVRAATLPQEAIQQPPPIASIAAVDFLMKTGEWRLFSVGLIGAEALAFDPQTFDPKKSLMVDEALEHPSVASFVC